MNFSKTGAGTVVLSSPNTFTGTMSVDAGALTLGATQRMASLTVANGASMPALSNAMDGW